MLFEIILFLSHGCFGKKPNKNKKKKPEKKPKPPQKPRTTITPNHPERNLKGVWEGGKERKARLWLIQKRSSVSKLSLCSVKGLTRSRGMYQPLRGINENFSSIRRASLKILSALHWRWREDISCPLFPSPSWKTSSYQNEQAPYCTVRQQQLHRAAWLFRWSCHYTQRGNPVPETAE